MATSTGLSNAKHARVRWLPGSADTVARGKCMESRAFVSCSLFAFIMELGS
jgi:hypothetical protein